MDLADLHDALMTYLRDGKFVEGIEDFYHADVVAQENSQPPMTGRDTLAANERRFQRKLTAYHGIVENSRAVVDRGHGNGIVFYECTMRWDQSDRNGTVVVEQAVVERWRAGKIAAIRFYGNYEPGELPAP